MNAGPEEILGQGEPGAIIEVIIDGMATVSTTVDDRGYWSVVIDLPVGEHLIDVRSLLGDLALAANDDPIKVMVLSPTSANQPTVMNSTLSKLGEGGRKKETGSVSWISQTVHV